MSQRDETVADTGANSIEAIALQTHGCCGRLPSDASPLWNDAGHRTQVERAVWLLMACEPAGSFPWLWTNNEFRAGIYKGLRAADYHDDFNNPARIDFGRGYELGPVYTSHFWDPGTGSNFVSDHGWLVLALRSGAATIKNWEDNALDMAIKFYRRSFLLRDQWFGSRHSRQDNDKYASSMGYELGVALHYLTDLTQPMHAANFTNVLGKGELPSLDDYRHAAFENRADKLLDLVSSPPEQRNTMLRDPSRANLEVDKPFGEVIKSAGRQAKTVFNTRLKDVVERLPRSRDEFPEDKALPALQEALPPGQDATASFLRLWARERVNVGMVSEWLTVTESRFGQAWEPTAFYFRDGDLHPAIAGGGPRHDRGIDPFFADFAAAKGKTVRAFAATFDPGTDHPALFMANQDGLFYIDTHSQPRSWRKTKVEGAPLPEGAMTAGFDQRTGRPSAFYRSRDGVLYNVYWAPSDAVWRCGTDGDWPRVGGAMSMLWDPTDCGLGGDPKGHIAVCYVRGDGFINCLRVRGGRWQSIVVRHAPDTDRDAGAHASPQMLATAFDRQDPQVALFWGLTRYVKKRVEDEKEELYYWEQQLPELRCSTIKNDGSVTTVPLEGAPAVGAIGAGSKPNLNVHFQSARDGRRMTFARLSDGKFALSDHGDSPISGTVAAVDSVNFDKTIVAFRNRLDVRRQLTFSEYR